MRRLINPAMVFVLASLSSRGAWAQWRVHVAGFGVMPVAGWQSDAYSAGGGVSLGAEWALAERFGLGATVGFAGLAAGDPPSAGSGIPALGAGSYGWGTLGARIRPMGYGTHGAERLWIAVDAGLAVTGRVLAPTLQARLGWAFAAGPVDLSPFVGWTWLPQTDEQAYPGDAQLVSLGLSVTLHPYRPAPPRAIRPPPVVTAPLAVATVPPEPPRQCPEFNVPSLPDSDGDGCPEVDRDQDGVRDQDDRCVTVAEDRDGFEDTDGCPEPDNDHDGIEDPVDRCPNEPEVINGVEDTDGCPDHGVVEVREGRIVIDEQVFFDTDSYRIRARSEPVLDAIARILRALPRGRVVAIEGHADNRGSDRYNFLLSFLRSMAVRRELIARHIRPNALRPLGYGRRVPRVQGSTPEALAANRRVELVVSGASSVGLAQTVGGWVQVSADGHLVHVPEPRP